MNISAEHKKYLSHKHTGGINNQKGNTYEAIYVTKEIVRLFAKGADINSTFLISQVKDSFVDDLCIIESDNRKSYHQIKDKKALSWGKDEPGNLLYDFKWQNHYSNTAKEKFVLKLVYSSTGSSVHKGEVPEEIRDVTVCECFPAYQNFITCLRDSEELGNDLRIIMNYPGNDFPLDMQSVSLELIRSQWMELAQPDTAVSLAQIKEAYERKHPHSPNFRTDPDVPLSSSVRETLSHFPEFHYSINGSNMYWKYRRMEGVTPVENVQAVLDTQQPDMIIDLISYLI